MGRKVKKWKKSLSAALAFSMLFQNFGIMGNAQTVKAADAKINISAENIKAKNANNHAASLIADGDYGTYWQSIPSNGEGDNLKRMYDHNHYIDITLDGTYELSQIKIFNLVNGSFNNYYVYASSDGENYDKIISKTSDDAATAEGDSFALENVSAAYLRLNMAYNSNAFATNLSEIEVYGTKISDTVPEPAEIQVEGWQGSSWQKEWDKFESNTAYANQKVINEMSSLVGRVIGEQWKKSFRFEMRNTLEEGKDIFEIKDGGDSTIVIRGNSGLAMASGFNYYLKNYVNVDYNPLYGSNVNLDELKPVGSKVVREAQVEQRYALNFCTYSYTMSFWNWDEYEEFLDWCAMNGINLVLDIVGQEEVLRQMLREFNYTDEEIKDYICGPAYFAWFYMQNLYSVGGPLPNAWFEQRTELGRKIHDRMQTYGINPVIQGFAGQVPETFAEKNEGAVLISTGNWSGFTRPTMLRTYLTDAEQEAGKVNYFSRAAQVFYEKQKNLFGDVSHYYATDPFHEGGNKGGLDAATIFEEVQKEMLKSDSDAIWIMQQWQGNLYHYWDNNKQDYISNISKLQKDHTLILGLQADMKTNEKNDFERWQMPWVYCMLHDFGGRMGLDGEVPVIAVDPVETLNNTNYMAGIGITAEGLENSPVVYELMFDTNWSKDPIDYYAWLKKYGERRAGGESESLWKAWKILLKTAYADKGITYQGAAETVINARPGDNFSSASTWGHSNILYDKAELDQALLLLAENYDAFKDSPAFQYDLADVAEQVLCNAAVEYHRLMVQAKNEKNLEEFEKLSTAFLNLIDLSDQILSATDEFMLGTWVEASRKMITDADDWTKDLFEFNARSLVTTWAGERPCNGGLKDYSNRKWAGLTGSFYKERWAIWIRNRIADIKGEARNAADAKAESNWFLWEYQWVNRKSDDDNGKYAFVTEPSGVDLAKLARQAYDKFSYTNLEKNTGGAAQDDVNVAEGKTAASASSTQSGALADITDGDTGTGWTAAGTGPHTVEIDLEKTYEISRIVLSGPQRAGDILYKWKMEYYNPDTAEWTLLKENTKYDMESNEQIELSEKCAARKLRVTIETSDAQSCPVEIVEITVNGVEEGSAAYENLAQRMTVTATVGDGGSAGGDLPKLTDGNTGNVWSAQNWQNGGTNFPVTVNMNMQQGQSTYVDTLEVYFESAGRPFAFYAEVTDETGTTEKVSPAGCESQEVTEKSYLFDVKKNISNVKVCITKNTGKGEFPGSWPAFAEIKVMGTPPVISESPEMLRARISEIRSVLDSVTYGSAKGNYKEEAKAKAEAVLTAAEAAAAGDIDSETVKEWLDKVNDALDSFYETGTVHLDRSSLLAAMAEAKDLMEKQEKYSLTDGKDELQGAYNLARTAYSVYNTVQSDLDTAVSALNAKVQEVNNSVGNEINVQEVAEEKGKLDQLLTEIGDKKKEDYSPESWKQYEETLEKINDALKDPLVTRETLASLRFRLEQLAQGLEDSVKVSEIKLRAAENKTELTEGETLQITADVFPEEADYKTLAWSLDNEAAAAVSQTGLVSAKAEGTVKITAAATDGSGISGNITLSIKKKAAVLPPEPEPVVNKLPDVGTIHKTATLEYKITASSEAEKTVIVQKSLKKNAKKIAVPAIVEIEGYEYKVTEIKAGAFKNSKITQVTIGANVAKIGKQAFSGCKKLSKIMITSKVLKSIGKKAFANIKKTAKITVPKNKFKKYKTYLKKAKTAGSVKIIKK